MQVTMLGGLNGYYDQMYDFYISNGDSVAEAKRKASLDASSAGESVPSGESKIDGAKVFSFIDAIATRGLDYYTQIKNAGNMSTQDSLSLDKALQLMAAANGNAAAAKDAAKAQGISTTNMALIVGGAVAVVALLVMMKK